MSMTSATGPEISIVVPVYKGVRFLRAALESVKAQTFRAWECVCVDDGSKDGSGALADEIAREDARIRVIHQPNGGTSVARNTALKAVKGRYVAFLDEDDLYHPRMLETLHAAAETTGADVVGCEVAYFREDERPKFAADEPPAPSAWKVADHAGVRGWMAEMYPGVPYEIWRNLYRREIAVGHVFVPGVRIEQDLLWHYTLLPQVKKYVRIPWEGYAWRNNSIGGFLHPDPASFISLTRSYRTLISETAREMELSEAQRARFAFRMSQELVQNLWRYVRGGLRLDRRQSAELRAGLRALVPYGADVRRDLGFKKRLAWNLFMLTGATWWVRERGA